MLHWWPAENGSGGDYLAEGKTRVVTKAGFYPVAHGRGTSDVAVNRKQPSIPHTPRDVAGEDQDWRLVGETSGGEREDSADGTWLGDSVQVKFWPGQDATAEGAHHVRGDEGRRP